MSVNPPTPKQMTKRQERTADLKSFGQRMMVAEFSRNNIEDYNFRKLVRSGVIVKEKCREISPNA